MSNFAIVVEGLGKRYRLGERVTPGGHGLLEALLKTARYPMRNLRALRELDRSDGNGDNAFWALRDVSFELKEGEVLGVVGRNGAGKSTLLKILSRITEATLGEARIAGRVGSLLEVGTGFHPELTGRENVYLNGSILGMRRSYIAAQFDEIVAFAGVEQFIDTPVKRFSSGMRLRLAFAVAAHLEPEVLVIDEVLAVGDAEFQRRCLAKMGDVARGGRTVLFVSHHLDSVRALCPRSLLLEKGRVTADGATADVLRQYMTTSSPELPGEWIDLSRTPRRGTGRARVRAVRYTADDPSLAFHPYPEGPLEFLLDVESDAARIVGSVGLSISTLSDTTLVTVDSMASGRGVSLRKGANRVRIAIENLHLMPGQYRVSFWIADPLAGTDRRAAFEMLHEVLDIEVVSRTVSAFRPRREPTVFSNGCVDAVPMEAPPSEIATAE